MSRDHPFSICKSLAPRYFGPRAHHLKRRNPPAESAAFVNRPVGREKMSSARRTRLLYLCASAALLSLGNPSHADVRPWVNFAGGSFNNAANWSLGAIPGPADTALFD